MDAWLKKSSKNANLKPPAAAAATSSSKAAATEASTSDGASFPKIKVKSTAAPLDPARQPWVEKYRPKSIQDVAAQDHTTAVLKKTLGSANLPHMLFYGPPGTGKTSTILALCRELFGPELMRNRVLELNASDERGISVVREKIKTFAKAAVSPPDPNFPSPPYKIIILDEADSMTQDAQSALRRIMETYSRITRFCLICNYVTRIIEPITSRCSKFRFKPLDQANTKTRLEYICDEEKVHYAEGSLDTLIKVSEGDLRRAITFLQSASKLHASADDPITPRSIHEIAGIVPDSTLARLVEALGVELTTASGDNDADMLDAQDVKLNSSAKNGAKDGFARVKTQVEMIVREGYSAWQILSQLHDLLILDPLLPSVAKAAIALAMGEADKCLNDGADEELQILHVCLQIRAAVLRG
ncbi:putative RFC2-DNA replication factor C, 41 kd subunit [Cystobasidium minutum MCA 4210]|uniref:putative RFC2-DNA replication factor C, 41 kd subunit n=1 Tax=Cystobasidium minutum MCA 4210 TaxID=1397322 RepID=UPI0034CD2CB6|eukprot:jgi/Rhomi1/186452/estExt_fgenesh1_pm.C_60149